MSYIDAALNNKGRALIVKKAVRTLKKLEFDSIVVRGMSGALVGPEVASQLEKNLVLVRKLNDDTHTHVRDAVQYECSRIGKYVILDDLVDTGRTLSAIYAAVDRENGFRRSCGDSVKKEVCVAVYLYNQDYHSYSVTRAMVRTRVYNNLGRVRVFTPSLDNWREEE